MTPSTRYVPGPPKTRWLRPLAVSIASVAISATALSVTSLALIPASTAALTSQADAILAPATRAGLMWWLIMVTSPLIGATQWGDRARRAVLLDAFAPPFVLGAACQVAWTLAAWRGHLFVATALIVSATGFYATAVWRLTKHRPAGFNNPLWYLGVDFPAGLLVGWHAVVALAGAGLVVDRFGLDDTFTAVARIGAICVFAGAVMGLAGRLYRQLGVVVAVLWGGCWLLWARFLGQPRSLLIGAVLLVAMFIIVAGFYASNRRQRRFVAGLESAATYRVSS